MLALLRQSAARNFNAAVNGCAALAYELSVYCSALLCPQKAAVQSIARAERCAWHQVADAGVKQGHRRRTVLARIVQEKRSREPTLSRWISQFDRLTLLCL